MKIFTFGNNEEKNLTSVKTPKVPLHAVALGLVVPTTILGILAHTHCTTKPYLIRRGR